MNTTSEDAFSGENASLREPATQLENAIIGGIYCTNSLFIAVAYILCLYAMYTTPHIWRNQCIKVTSFKL